MQATTIEGQNHCALHTKFHVSDSPNTHNHITSDGRSKRAWSYCVLCIPFILSGSPNQCWLHTCDACLITTWRLGLRAPLVVRNKFVLLTGKVLRTLTTTTWKRMIELKINISKTIAGHWLVYAWPGACYAMHWILWYFQVELCSILHVLRLCIWVNLSHLYKHNKLKYERNSVCRKHHVV